jgi:hypothetical protein
VALDPWDGTPVVTHLPAPTYPLGVAAADLNRDGSVDLVSSNLPSEVRVWLGNGRGGFGPPARFDTGDGPYAVVIADLDGDGWADLATADNTSNTVSVLFGDGAGGFGVPPTVGVPSPSRSSALTLAPVHPNPVASAATIRFVLPGDGLVTLTILDVAGRRVARLEDGFLPAGEHAARWDRRGADGAIVPPGVYVCELRFGGKTRSGRISVLE